MPLPPLPDPSSAVAGFLAPAPPPAPSPTYGDPLEDLFHDTLAGITGLAPSLVRPRWQPNPPDQPAFDVDWAAFGIARTKKDWNAYVRHVPVANADYGADELSRNEELHLLFSFYGPNSMAMQSRFEDGLAIEQNRAPLAAAGVLWISMDESHQVPALLNERWVKRVDQRMLFKRNVVRQYPILNLVAADVRLYNELYVTDIEVTPPSP